MCLRYTTPWKCDSTAHYCGVCVRLCVCVCVCHSKENNFRNVLNTFSLRSGRSLLYSIICNYETICCVVLHCLLPMLVDGRWEMANATYMNTNTHTHTNTTAEELGGWNFCTVLSSICCGHPPVAWPHGCCWLRLTSRVQWGIGALETRRVQMALSMGGAVRSRFSGIRGLQ